MTVDALPLPALQLLLRFALERFSDDMTARNTSVCAPALQQLATVSRSWHAAMSTVLDARNRSARTFTLASFDSACSYSTSHTSHSAVQPQRSDPTDRLRKVSEARPARLPAPSSRIARSVASFFSSIVSKAHAQHAFPWEDHDSDNSDDSSSHTATTTPVAHSHSSHDASSAPTPESIDHALKQHALSEIERVRAELAAMGSGSGSHKLQELRLCEADADSRSKSNAEVHAEQQQTWDALERAWDHVFCRCKNLQRLDLSRLSLMSPHLPAILLSAATHCKRLKTLILPQQECVGYERRNVQPVFNAFYAALERLRSRPTDAATSSTSSTLTQRRRERGLARLVMPKLFAYEFYDEHMFVIARACDALEHVDGLRLAPIFQARGLSHHAVLQSWLHAWAHFCRACTHLRVWNWFEIPFVDAFFRVFAAEPKHALQTLTLPGNTTLWKRDYVYAAHQDEAAEPADCRCTPDGMHALVRACPNLTTLEVLFSDRHLLFGSADAFLIGDAFLDQVVRACPRIETLRLTEVEARHGVEVTNAITPDGVAALASLEHLQLIELSGVALSASALFALATQPHADDSNRPRRRVRATVGVRGIRKSEIASVYNQILTELLERLVETERRTLPPFVLELRIDTANHQLPVQWSAHYRRKWLALKQALVATHGSGDQQLRLSLDLVRAVATISSS